MVDSVLKNHATLKNRVVYLSDGLTIISCLGGIIHRCITRVGKSIFRGISTELLVVRDSHEHDKSAKLESELIARLRCDDWQ